MKKFLASLMVLAVLSITASSVMARPPAPAPTIVDIVVTVSGASGYDTDGNDFDILREAVIALDLAGTLSERGQYTVFAPNDAAFVGLASAIAGQDVPEDQVIGALVAALGSPDAVRDVVLYHVAPGRRAANSVVNAKRIRTLSRGFIAVDGTVLNGNVNIIATDIAASNGIVHVIDSVLLPQ